MKNTAKVCIFDPTTNVILIGMEFDTVMREETSHLITTKKIAASYLQNKFITKSL